MALKDRNLKVSVYQPSYILTFFLVSLILATSFNYGNRMFRIHFIKFFSFFNVMQTSCSSPVIKLFNFSSFFRVSDSSNCIWLNIYNFEMAQLKWLTMLVDFANFDSCIL